MPTDKNDQGSSVFNAKAWQRWIFAGVLAVVIVTAGLLISQANRQSEQADMAQQEAEQEAQTAQQTAEAAEAAATDRPGSANCPGRRGEQC